VIIVLKGFYCQFVKGIHYLTSGMLFIVILNIFVFNRSEQTDECRTINYIICKKQSSFLSCFDARKI
jgi:hypothetical protein